MAFRIDGTRARWAQAGRWLLLAGVALLVPAGARAADPETREFSVFVEGKPSGKAVMTIRPRDGGITEMSCDTNILVRILVLKYRYTLQSREFWKGGQLLGFESRTNDDGKQYAVNGVISDGALHLKVNNQQRKIARTDFWLTSYWNLPDAKRREGALPLIDVDTGAELSGRLQFIGSQQMGIAGQTMNVDHYRLNGSRQNDLWYDASGRLVRQEFVEEGRRVILVLTGLR